MEENTQNAQTQPEAPAEGKTFTQAEVDDLVKTRLDRAEKKWQEKYANYFSADDLKSKTEDLNKQITDLGNSLTEASAKATSDADTIAQKDQTIADLQSQLAKHETDSAKIRIALEEGIPYELANKLSGTNEEELRADAKKMSSFFGSRFVAPARNPESEQEDGVTAAFRKLNPNIKI